MMQAPIKTDKLTMAMMQHSIATAQTERQTKNNQLARSGLESRIPGLVSALTHLIEPPWNIASKHDATRVQLRMSIPEHERRFPITFSGTSASERLPIISLPRISPSRSRATTSTITVDKHALRSGGPWKGRACSSKVWPDSKGLPTTLSPAKARASSGFPLGIIRFTRNDTEKISMAPAQG